LLRRGKPRFAAFRRMTCRLAAFSVICCMAAWRLLPERGFFSIHSEKHSFLLEKSIIYVILLIVFKQ